MEKENLMHMEEIELRCEEIKIEELFWNHVRLQMRVDDLESTLAHVLNGLVDAENREERLWRLSRSRTSCRRSGYIVA